LERNLTGFSAFRTDSVIHLTGAVASGITLASNSAGLAALWFIRKAFFGEKFLLAGSKGEFLSAIFADDGFVAVH
jgi:hypothetical protein